MIEVGHATHLGLRRDCNEDSYWADRQLGLFLVVDGMGGCGRGDVAAAIARDALVAAVRAGSDLTPAIHAASTGIATLPSVAPHAAPTGATLAVLRIDGDRYVSAQVGDARAYLWQHGTLARVGAAGPAAASDTPPVGELPPPRRNRATHALGITPPADFQCEPVHGTLQRGMQFLLCTSGLGEELDDAQIAAILARSHLGAQECVDHLILGALDAGGRDNVSMVLVRVA